MYQLTFDNQESEQDAAFENNGVKVVVDRKSYLYLIGTTLDFSGGLNGKGFVFNNPNADRTCGCGESFSV
jgi:iron-sulfur cluster assembly protein